MNQLDYLLLSYRPRFAYEVRAREYKLWSKCTAADLVDVMDVMDANQKRAVHFHRPPNLKSRLERMAIEALIVELRRTEMPLGDYLHDFWQQQAAVAS